MNIILTGCEDEMGRMTALSLADKGHTLFVVVDRDAIRSHQINADCFQEEGHHGRIVLRMLNLSDRRSVDRTFAEIAEITDGKINVVINNVQMPCLFSVRTIISDNIFKAALRFMKPKKRGLLLSVSGTCSDSFTEEEVRIDRIALDALAVSYHFELKGSGIDVAVLHPDPATFGFERFRYAPAMPDPAVIMENIIRLIELPQGKRPLWTVVDAHADRHLLEHVVQLNKGMAWSRYLVN